MVHTRCNQVKRGYVHARAHAHGGPHACTHTQKYLTLLFLLTPKYYIMHTLPALFILDNKFGS